MSAMQYKSALNLSSFRLIEVPPSKFGKVPWTFQIVDVVFVLRASTYSLYFECGYLDYLDWQSWHHEWQFHVCDLRRPFENCEFTPLLYRITLILSFFCCSSTGENEISITYVSSSLMKDTVDITYPYNLLNWHVKRLCSLC